MAKVFWVLTCCVGLLPRVGVAQTRPTTVEIRRGFAMATTEPAQRQQMVLEQIARKIEPELVGNAANLPAYVEFFKRESIRDPRLFAVDVNATVSDDGAIVLRGFVEYRVHQAAIELLLRTLRFEKIENRIAVVGESDMKFGVVRVPRTFVYDRVGEPRENLTQLLFGEPVFILRDTGDGYLWMHASDGYVGYVRAPDVTEVTAEQFTKYQRGARARLQRDVEAGIGKLPAGARLWIDKRDANTLACKSLDVGNFDIQRPPFVVPAAAIVEANNSQTLEKIEGAILTATKLMRTKYVWGGRTADGIDCSGLTQMAYQSQGINLPRDADQQATVGRLVALHGYRDAMARGDLMFFISRRGTIGHVAIYLGDNQYLEAADGGVKISSMDPNEQNFEPKRERAFAFARRLIE